MEKPKDITKYFWFKEGDSWVSCPDCKQFVVRDKEGELWPAPGNAQSQEDDFICDVCGSRQ